MNALKRIPVITTVLWALGMGCLSLPALAQPAPLTDKLLSELLDRHAPEKVFEQGENPWPGGDFSVQVLKNGAPQVTSRVQSIHVQMPLKIVIEGNASSSFLRMQLQCTASFTTLGEVVFTPRIPGLVNAFDSSITLPVPPVVASCDGMQLPIDEYLQALVNQKKRQWEVQLDEEVNQWLAK